LIWLAGGTESGDLFNLIYALQASQAVAVDVYGHAGTRQRFEDLAQTPQLAHTRRKDPANTQISRRKPR
jgi:hypothetical protein